MSERADGVNVKREKREIESISRREDGCLAGLVCRKGCRVEGGRVGQGRAGQSRIGQDRNDGVEGGEDRVETRPGCGFLRKGARSEEEKGKDET